MRMVPRLLDGLVTTAHLEHVPTLLPLCMMCTQPVRKKRKVTFSLHFLIYMFK